MRQLIYCALMLTLATSLSACGVKGSLKTPTQAKLEQEKKERKAAKKQAQEQAASEETTENEKAE